MNWRGSLIGLLALAGLALAVFFVVQKDEREGRRELAELVFPYNTRDVEALDVRHELGSARFERGAEGWQRLEGSEQARAERVPEVIAAWSRVRFIEVLDEQPTEEELERFGLAPPAASLSARLVPGRREAAGRAPRIEIGKPLPLSPGYYARVDGFPRVVAVTPEVVDILDGVGRELFGEKSELEFDEH